MAGDAGLRAVGAGGLHVTVAFLGSRPAARRDAIWEAARAAADGLPTPMFEPTGIVGVPPRRPRLFALGLTDVGGLGADMQEAVATALGATGEYAPEQRPFWPHVTVARVRKGARAKPAGEPSLERFAPPALTLFRSHTSPRGARYEALERLALREG